MSRPTTYPKEDDMITISSNGFSVDDQIADAVSYLSNTHFIAGKVEEDFHRQFPEYNTLVWSGAWVDPEASGVDPEYMCFVADWLESNTPICWSDGEPVIFEEGDDPDE